ncbi:MAG: translation elongation factor Ts [Oceanococcaceae bacterium]
MAITASLVKELRERTGAAMMDCKRALEATAGDLEAAIEKMRADGQAKADKKASRVAAEGVVRTAVSADGKTAAMVELNCETDFVAKNEDFLALADAAAQAALTAQSDNVDTLLAAANGAQTVDETRRALIAKLGENMTLRRAVLLSSTGHIGSYIHGGRIGVLVALEGGDADLGLDLALHIAASNPQFLDESVVPAEELEKEKRVLIAQAEGSGKPMEIIEKMVEGRLRKYMAEITLVGQPFVKDPDQTVAKLLAAKQAKVLGYQRLVVGEGIEKEESNFADEVAAQAAAAAR